MQPEEQAREAARAINQRPSMCMMGGARGREVARARRDVTTYATGAGKAGAGARAPGVAGRASPQWAGSPPARRVGT